MRCNKKILHLCSNKWNSAITEYCLRMAEAMEMQGYENYIICLDQGLLYQRAKDAGLKVIGIKNFSVLNLFMVLKNYREIQADSIFCYGGKESFLSYFLKAAKKFRFVGDFNRRRSIRSKLNYFFLSKTFTNIIFPSHALKEVHGWQGMVLPFGSDEKTYFYEKTSQSLRPEILLLGRFDPVKGHKEAFSMLSWLLKMWPDDQPRPFLRVIGREENLKKIEIEMQAEYLGLQLDLDVFIEEGSCANLPRKIRESSLGLVSSRESEWICRVGVEFLLSGVPVFVSGVGSLNELIVDPMFGASFRGQTLEERVIALAKLLRSSHSEKEDIRQLRAERARQFFSQHVMGTQVKELLDG